MKPLLAVIVVALAVASVWLLRPPSPGDTEPPVAERDHAAEADPIRLDGDPPATVTTPTERTAAPETAPSGTEADRGVDAERRAVLVRVTDSAGRPAPNVPVCIAAHDTRWRTVWRANTDANGLAKLDDLGQALGEREPERAIAVVALPLADRPHVEFAPDDPPPEVELALPPVGAVEVTLTHPDPTRLRGASVRIRSAADDRATLGDRDVTVTCDNGLARFEQIGLGLDLRIVAQLDGGNLSRRTAARGPEAPGQSVFVTLSMQPTKPVLVAILQTEDEQRLKDANLLAQMKALRRGSSSSSSFNTKTDSEGVLRLELTDDLGTDAERSLQLSTTDRERSVMVAVPAVLAIGDNDLGVLTLEPPPTLCAGVVEDRTGKRIANATVELRRKRIYDPDRPDRFNWDYTGVPSATSGEDGAFAVTGTVLPAEFAITVSHDDYLAARNLAIVAGSTDLRIVLDRAGAVAGSVAAGDFSLRRRLRIALENDEGREFDVEPDADGSWEIGSLPPGTYRGVIELFGQLEPLVRAGGIVVRSGEVTRDPRLQDVDLGARLREVTFRVVDTRGTAIRDAAALLLPAGIDADRFGGVFVNSGVGRVLATTTPVGLFAWAKGYRGAIVHDLRDGHDVVLADALDLRIRVSPEAVAAAQPDRLRCSLSNANPRFSHRARYELRGENNTNSRTGGVPWEDTLRARVDGGVAAVPVLHPGKYGVQWWLVTAGGDRTAITFPDEVDVADRPGAQEHESALTVAAIEAARENR